MLLDEIKKYRIVLASQSPRRHYLLKGLGINFEIITKEGLEENYPPEMQAEQVPVYLAEKKAEAFENIITDKTILITADTIVHIENEVLGKPINQLDAVNILKKLSGRSHIVVTGICLKSKKQQHTFSAKTEVHFKELTESEINYYVENYEPYDKAGAYGAQEWIGYIAIDKIVGSYFNVMGLPIQKLYLELSDFINTIENE